ncbi:MAG: hypothetical protein AAF720_00695 [Pseudomonadota bacterium]
MTLKPGEVDKFTILDAMNGMREFTEWIYRLPGAEIWSMEIYLNSIEEQEHRSRLYVRIEGYSQDLHKAFLQEQTFKHGRLAFTAVSCDSSAPNSWNPKVVSRYTFSTKIIEN